MALTRKMIENALEMTLDDYIENKMSVTEDELKDVQERFNHLIDVTLVKECEDEDDDDDDDDETEIEEEDEEK